ncbi:hypothetical protein IFM46972_01680 [Aspergillus udagawae]|uniref:Phosphoglycerate mutase family protein n=1 Tax=Aspergillus udagawae TaxID=91492 RepID=A0A8H3N467_9EURO|nr:hypothetical protein IFM46972_01680 [Aspergillus udagawae]
MQSTPTVYMIRHGEKPRGGAPNLSAQGEARAQRLRKVFGKEGGFNIGYIIAEHPRKDGSRARSYETVQPLANDLKDLGVEFNTDIKKHDAVGVARAVKEYHGTGNVLICWEHHNLSDIAEAIGIKEFAKTSGWSGKLEYPDSRFDLIWVAPTPYNEITEVLSEDNL